jgi:hypothetical protein
VKAKQQKEQQQADQADAEPVQLPEQQQQEAAEGSTLKDGEEPAVAVQPQGQAAAVMQEEQEQQLGASTLAGSEASQHVSLLQQQLRQQQEISPQLEAASVGALAADGAAAVIPAAAAGTSSGAGAGGGSSGLSKQQLLAAAKQLNMRKLLVSVVLLRHLAYGCEDTQAALTAEGLVSIHVVTLQQHHQHTVGQCASPTAAGAFGIEHPQSSLKPHAILRGSAACCTSAMQFVALLSCSARLGHLLSLHVAAAAALPCCRWISS